MIVVSTVIGDGTQFNPYRPAIMDDVVLPWGGKIDASYTYHPDGVHVVVFVPESPRGGRSKAQHVAMKALIAASADIVMTDDRSSSKMDADMSPGKLAEIKAVFPGASGKTVADVVLSVCREANAEFPAGFVKDETARDVPEIVLPDGEVIGG